MLHRTSLPVLTTLFALLLAAPACDGGDDGSSSNGGGGSGAGTNSGGGGSDTSSGGAGGAGGEGGGITAPACDTREITVAGCLLPPTISSEPIDVFSFQEPITVTAVRAAGASEPCHADEYYFYRVGSGRAEVIIEGTTESGADVMVGIDLPGFTESAVAVGDVLDVTFDVNRETTIFGGKISSLRIERSGQLVAAVGENDPVGLPLTEGETSCYRDTDLCGYEEHTITVEASGGEPVSIKNGETATVGDLEVTNDRYYRNYDTSGGCNFGLDVEYLIGATTAAVP
ncbi:hypothetical protein [Chondromyces apiculatus]|uniref:Lipoprotein n=1 Tax=Chondromyces apiculatus DSM 436 TaxID=1192034 RepID=A0A017SZB2_9BACT|nr:hypothetical protein [Chondromyces apiculatus]EYF01945.1 Hypothetical protein CAP_7563 [Chondromyces apiculatus DSM 436]